MVSREAHSVKETIFSFETVTFRCRRFIITVPTRGQAYYNQSMGKGSEACVRAGLSLEDTSGVLEEENKFPTSQQSFAELDYSLSTIVKPWSKMKWRSGDGKVLYFKDEKGWYAHANYEDLKGASSLILSEKPPSLGGRMDSEKFMLG
jgi:hypothetical protein